MVLALLFYLMNHFLVNLVQLFKERTYFKVQISFSYLVVVFLNPNFSIFYIFWFGWVFLYQEIKYLIHFIFLVIDLKQISMNTIGSFLNCFGIALFDVLKKWIKRPSFDEFLKELGHVYLHLDQVIFKINHLLSHEILDVLFIVNCFRPGNGWAVVFLNELEHLDCIFYPLAVDLDIAHAKIQIDQIIVPFELLNSTV